MKLEFDDMVFLYVLHGGIFYYEYYGKNKYSHITHSETDKVGFVKMIHNYRAIERDNKINEILS